MLLLCFCCGSQFIHHGQQVFSFAAAGVFRMLLFICKLPSNPGQFCSSTFILGGEDKHVMFWFFFVKTIFKMLITLKNSLV